MERKVENIQNLEIKQYTSNWHMSKKNKSNLNVYIFFELNENEDINFCEMWQKQCLKRHL